MFVTTREDPPVEALAFFRESEGISVVLPRSAALDLGFDDGPPMKLITLNVYSSLEEIGLTAAVATCLAGHGIACNMIAAFHHDHLLVPADRAEEALDLLMALRR